MTNTVDVASLWEWLAPALQDLKQGYVEDPTTSWEERRETLLAQLGVQDASEHPVTEELLGSLDELDDEGRDELLRGDQLDAMAYAVAERHAADLGDAGDQDDQEPPDAAQEPDATYDEDAWHAFTAEYLAAWDGSPGSWDQFKEWFAYYADQRGLGQPGVELLSYLDGLDGPGRVAAFATYGVVVVAEEQTLTGGSPEETAAAESPVQLDPATEAILAEVVAEDPEEFEDISEERLRELMAEALAEVAEEAAQQEERERDEELT